MTIRDNRDRASVVLCRCSKTRGMFGIRTEQVNPRTWVMTWAFRIREKSAKNEGYDRNEISGEIHCIEEYPGCPYCGNMCWFICNNCDKLTCTDNDSTFVKCAWCGDEGYCTPADYFELSGSGY